MSSLLRFDTLGVFGKTHWFELVKLYLGVLKGLNNAFYILGKNYLSLDWHSRAKQLFYNEKAAEDIAQDKSFHDKSPAKKQQSVSLSECLELYTSKEQLGEDDAW